VLDHVQSKLNATTGVAADTAAALGFARRVFIGEFGTKPAMTPNEFETNRYACASMSGV
jgi:hypothetical protein